MPVSSTPPQLVESETGVRKILMDADTRPVNKQVPQPLVAAMREACEINEEDGNQFLRNVALSAAAANQVGCNCCSSVINSIIHNSISHSHPLLQALTTRPHSQVVLTRGLAILSEMPALVTLLDLQTGTSAFQNRQSREVGSHGTHVLCTIPPITVP